MIAKNPAHAIEMLDDAFNRGDVEAILRYYDPAAVVLPEPGQEIRGEAALRSLYKQFTRPGTVARQLQTHVVEADGIALFTSRWSLSVDSGEPQTFVATVVLRQQPDGGWKALIDNARGPQVLEPQQEQTPS